MMLLLGTGFRVHFWSSALDEVTEKSGFNWVLQREGDVGVREPRENVPGGNWVKMFGFNTSGFLPNQRRKRF